MSLFPGMTSCLKRPWPLAFLASAGGLVSIALSHACLGASLVLLVASKTPLRFTSDQGSRCLPSSGLRSFPSLASDVPVGRAAANQEILRLRFSACCLLACSRVGMPPMRLIQAWFILAGATAAVPALCSLSTNGRTPKGGGGGFLPGLRRSTDQRFVQPLDDLQRGRPAGVRGARRSYLLFSEQGRKKTRVFWVGCGVP